MIVSAARMRVERASCLKLSTTDRAEIMVSAIIAQSNFLHVNKCKSHQNLTMPVAMGRGQENRGQRAEILLTRPVARGNHLNLLFWGHGWRHDLTFDQSDYGILKERYIISIISYIN